MIGIQSFLTTMHRILRTEISWQFQISCIRGIAWLVAALAVFAVQAQQNPGSPSSHTIRLESGQRLSFAIAQPKTNDSAATGALNRYRQQAFPLAKTHGLRPEFTFKVSKVVLGQYTPVSVAMFSWPDALSETEFSAEPEWPTIKALRPQAWDELKIYTDDVPVDTELTLSADKFYTLAIAWFSHEHPTDYDRYMQRIKQQAQEVGAKFLFKLRSPVFESVADKHGSPGQVTLVEWPNRAALAALQASEVYQSNKHLFKKGVSQFEFYVLQPQF